MAKNNKYPGVCYYCDNPVAVGEGCFQKKSSSSVGKAASFQINGKWLLIHNAAYAGGSCIEKQRLEKSHAES